MSNDDFSAIPLDPDPEPYDPDPWRAHDEPGLDNPDPWRAHDDPDTVSYD